MNEDQLRAKALVLFHSLVSNWANELRGDVNRLQEQVNRQLDALQETMAKYEENIDERKILSFVDEIGQAGGGSASDGGELSQVRQSMAQLEQGTSLQEILTHLVREMARYAPRVALFGLKGGGCRGLFGQGFDQSPGFSNEEIRRIQVPSNADTVFRAVVTSRKSFAGESTAHRDDVKLLTRMGNVLPSSIFATPIIVRERIAAVAYADSGDSSEALDSVEAMEILVLYACKLMDSMSGGGAKAAGRTTSEVAPEQAERLRDSVPSPVASTPEPVSEPTPEPSLEPEVASHPVMLKSSDLRSSPGVVATEAPPLPHLEGEQRKQHEDAKRFARLLVSEIKLYNETKVQAGRKSGNIYGQLKDDIERSRQLYSERVAASIRTSSKYFDEELVRILADGDQSIMGNQG